MARFLAIDWDQSIYDLDYFVIPKGTKNKDTAEKYIAVLEKLLKLPKPRATRAAA